MKQGCKKKQSKGGPDNKGRQGEKAILNDLQREALKLYDKRTYRQDNSDVGRYHHNSIDHSEELSKPDLGRLLGENASPDKNADDDNVEDQGFIVCQSQGEGKRTN